MLCERLGMTLQEAQQKISSSEFTLWKVYLQEEPTRFHRDDYNFAMIAAEVRRVLHKKPNSVKEKDFMLRFKNVRKEKIKRENADVEKMKWATAFGIDPPPLGEEEESDVF